MNPNFFIVGGAKCATTNISYYLNDHPDIFFPELNEPYYYCKFDVPKIFKRESMITDKKKYLNLFKKATYQKVIGEATPVYLQCPNAAKQIKKDFPNSKILISIRNPIDKAHSSYYSYKFMNLDKRTFSEKIDIYEKKLLDKEFDLFNFIEDGFFSKHIQRFQRVFSPEQIKIIFFEDYVKNIPTHINSILNFLEIKETIPLVIKPKNSFRVPKNQFSKYLLNNKTFRNISTKLIPTITRDKIGERFFVKQSTKPSMSVEDRERLKKIFLNEYIDLKNLLDIELPWKDFQ